MATIPAKDHPRPRRGTNRVQIPSPDTGQRRPTSPNVPAGQRLSRRSKTWPAFSQRRYISYRSANQSKHALAGRADLRDGRPQSRAALGGVTGCGIPSISPRATTRRPGGRARRCISVRVEGCPRVAAWSGYARSTGCHSSPSVQDLSVTHRHVEESGRENS